MRIVHVITRLIVGGAQENTLLSCQAQHEHGHDVTLITGPPLGPEGSLMNEARSGGFKIEVIDQMRRAILPVKDWQTYRMLMRRFREIKPDVVHTHSSKAGIIGRRVARAAGVPLIVHTVHGLAFTASTHRVVNDFYKYLERRAAPLTDRIVCVADAMRNQSLAAGIGEAKQYVTIYSGMRTEPFLNSLTVRDEMRARLGLKSEHVAVGTIARLFDLKGHDDLLELAPELCGRLPNLRFLWVGDGKLRGEFERRMNEMGLRDRFILTGLVPPEKVPELTGAMDLLVHPSRREGLARALPQAALCGKPVIAYDIDGNGEGMINGQTGFLLRPFEKPKLAEAIARLADDASLRAEMGGKGREFAMGRFDVKVMAAALEDLYSRKL
ncbi:MAG TPA: glycosyltransferase family 4 protein [Tepidisphaeraceae bacterium]|nr:glycosyltransferase family 4 protein [Tepidisphaeraceae bacterium]